MPEDYDEAKMYKEPSDDIDENDFDEDIDEDEILEELDEFDFERLVVEGKDSVLKREIVFFDLKTQQKMKMPVYIKPLSRMDRNRIEKAISKKNTNGRGKKVAQRNFIEMVCEAGWVQNTDGVKIPLEDIRKVSDGATAAISEEIRFISGEFEDRFETKAIKELFGNG